MNKLLTNFPVALTEEQKNVLKLTLSAVLQDDPITKYWRPTVYENGDIMWALVASESEPLSQNIKGPSGFTPQFQIDQSTAEWQVTYDGTNWTPLGIIASGAQGPQGIPGKDGTNGTNGTNGTDGEDGTSVYLKSVTDAQGGKQVTLGWGTSDTSAFVIPSGTPGTPGTNGVSPTVTITDAPTDVHTQGGKTVTITDADHPTGQSFDIWNGEDGTGSSDVFDSDTISGGGTQASPYGVDTSIIATRQWVTDQSFLDDVAAGGSISGDGTVSSPLGLKTSAENALDIAQQLTPPENTQAVKQWIWQNTTPSHPTTPSGWVDATDVMADVVMNWMDSYLDDWISNGIGLSANWVGEEGFQKFTFGVDTTNMSANKQYAFTTSGWTEVQGGGGGEANIIESIRLEGDSADVTITDKKATIPLATASATGVAGNTGVITKDDKAHLDAAIEYKENPYDSSSPKALIPQQMFVCESDQQIIDIVTNHTDLINGKGTIFFRITGI